MKNILFCCCLFLFSCENDHDYNEYLSNGLKRFADFKVGSYWIYQRDSSSIIDTIKVIAYKRGFEARQSDSNIAHKEFIKMTLKSSYDSSIIYDELSSWGYSRRIYKYFVNDTVTWGDFSHVNYKIVTYNNNNVEYLLNCNIREVVYDTIIHLKSQIFKYYKHKETENYKIDMYFSLNKGLIQRTYYDSQKKVNWYLIKEKIYR